MKTILITMKTLCMKLFTGVLALAGIAMIAAFGHCGKSSSNGNGPRTDTTAGTPTTDTLTYVYKTGTESYSCFRIPAIVRTKKGTLLAFAEGRKNSCSDNGDINLVVKRSLNNGITWDTTITVWNDGKNTCGNPVPVVDAQTGNIILLMSWNYGPDDIGDINAGTGKDTRRVFVTTSADDGITWATPTEITSSVKKAGWGWYATGPCHGLQVSKGQYAGRIVVPCDYIEVNTKKGSSHVFYSDDRGLTWKPGGVPATDKTNESSVCELSDGRLMLNMRSSTGFRQVATSSDGGSTWNNVHDDVNLIDPVCQGSIINGVYNNEHQVLFSNCFSTTRDNITIRMSNTNGSSWPKTYKVYEGPAAYSDLVMLPNDQVGILYEAGKAKPYEGIAFKIIPLSKFK
jgi:sialidase-1